MQTDKIMSKLENALMYLTPLMDHEIAISQAVGEIEDAKAIITDKEFVYFDSVDKTDTVYVEDKYREEIETVNEAAETLKNRGNSARLMICNQYGVYSELVTVKDIEQKSIETIAAEIIQGLELQ